MLVRVFVLFSFLLVLTRGKTVYKDYKPEYKLEKGEYPEKFATLETLTEFVRLVNEHKLNVSLIMSMGKNYDNGNLKEVTAMTMNFPVNSETITKEATLKEADFEKLAKIATKEKIVVAGSISQINNGTLIVSNNIKEVPITKSHKIFTGIKHGKTGFVFDDKNYAAQYTFITHGADGKNTTTKVFHGDVQVDVVDSGNLKDPEITTIKKALTDAYFTYESDVMPKALAAMLSKKLPGTDWDVAQISPHSYIDAQKWVEMKIVEDEFLVYSI
ncbi:uncharacterized protein LOC658401 [Tribolium castaneum]|uniref:Uncharacterized protein n=1 Tax=Tribolium castaneum TaxID=7070 RepID=D6WW81_TRICA|nr:PREDICTED: uncharacterized protein LOC658401 [Tribolium castaneum]EFA08171.1 hypothetical protein TcasGA2_TC005795 [Tribolium castaneum]|eukprot:XP_975796.1 PREDICTED: uncharacterized protein LOC658401 [Tribolium castaneum]